MKDSYQLSRAENFKEGFRDGIPIGLGYLAVSFSLGIAARDTGMSAVQGFFASLITLASAGEYVGFSLMLAKASYLEMVFAMIITNARYFLMSCSLSQKLSPETGLGHRMLVAIGVTDEIFGISVSRKGVLSPFYNYGAICISAPLWAIGTSLGLIAGNLLPDRLVSALSVALYGMFIAIIIPPARDDKVIRGIVIIAFIISYLCGIWSVTAALSSGSRTILITIVIAAAAAILFPVKDEEGEDHA